MKSVSCLIEVESTLSLSLSLSLSLLARSLYLSLSLSLFLLSRSLLSRFIIIVCPFIVHISSARNRLVSGEADLSGLRFRPVRIKRNVCVCVCVCLCMCVCSKHDLEVIFVYFLV